MADEYDLSKFGGALVSEPDEYDLSKFGGTLVQQSSIPKEKSEENIGQKLRKTFVEQASIPLNLFAGIGQGLANIPIGLADIGISGLNFIPGINLPKIHKLESEQKGLPGIARNLGEIAGEIGGLGIGGNLANAIKNIPRLQKVAQSIPYNEYIGRLLNNAFTKGATAGAIVSPEDQLTGAALGGITGGTASALSNYPKLRAALGGSLGSAIGYQAAGIPGATIGALGGGYLGYKPGATQRQLETFSNIANPEEAKAAEEAAQRLGLTQYSIGSSSADPFIKQAEAQLGFTRKGAYRLRELQGKTQQEQKQSLDRLFGEIAPENYQTEVVTPLYEKSFKDSISDREMNELLKDPYFGGNRKKGSGGLVKSVLDEPSKYERLKNVPLNSIEFIDELKVKLDGELNQAKVKNDTDKIRDLTEKRAKLLEFADKASPDYAAARYASQKQITRRELEDAIRNEPTGQNFYKSFLEDEKSYKNLRSKLYDRDNPTQASKAQQTLDDMRKSFKNISNPLTQTAIRTAGGTEFDPQHSISHYIIDFMRKLSSGRMDKAGIDIISSPIYQDKLHRIAQIEDKKRQAIEFSRLMNNASVVGVEKTFGSLLSQALQEQLGNK